MSNFLKIPHVPKGNVNLCCIAEGYDKIKKSLEDLSVKVIECRGSDKISLPLRNHADINMCHLGGESVICDKANEELYKSLEKYNFKVKLTDDEVKSPYPHDVPLNVLMLNDTLFYGKSVCEDIKDFVWNKKYRFAPVKQGYVKCTTCVVNCHSVITSDRGTASVFKKTGLDVLLIDEGYIDLAGYDYGFIGGCSGLISKDTLAFTGDITKHKSWKKIKDFLSVRNIKYISLTDERPVDIGSILPLAENQI